MSADPDSPSLHTHASVAPPRYDSLPVPHPIFPLITASRPQPIMPCPPRVPTMLLSADELTHAVLEPRSEALRIQERILSIAEVALDSWSSMANFINGNVMLEPRSEALQLERQVLSILNRLNTKNFPCQAKPAMLGSAEKDPSSDSNRADAGTSSIAAHPIRGAVAEHGLPDWLPDWVPHAVPNATTHAAPSVSCPEDVLHCMDMLGSEVGGPWHEFADSTTIRLLQLEKDVAGLMNREKGVKNAILERLGLRNKSKMLRAKRDGGTYVSRHLCVSSLTIIALSHRDVAMLPHPSTVLHGAASAFDPSGNLLQTVVLATNANRNTAESGDIIERNIIGPTAHLSAQ
ncbi:hypothetical protein P280DRAFT_530832 [Massarina eburnea CBS 473.64]|uniref:Uncharacterized protein n=1 Tax=Massarina eburnea CBS 473.64 TaxID=1395130 RepID=A0A6A6RRA5_9PLEO|nr:hypothetical protein P280DRAFT_530832 [Massarina eburnea CBS 473.64]